MFLKNANYAQCDCEPQNDTEIKFWRSFVSYYIVSRCFYCYCCCCCCLLSNTTVNCFCLLSSAPENGLFHLHCNWLMSYFTVENVIIRCRGGGHITLKYIKILYLLSYLRLAVPDTLCWLGEALQSCTVLRTFLLLCNLTVCVY